MKLSKTAISGFVVVSLFISVPAFGAPKTHKKVVVAKKSMVIKKVALTPAVTAQVTIIPEVAIITPTSNVATSFVFRSEADAAFIDPVLEVQAPPVVQTPIVQMTPPVVVQPSAPVFVSQSTIVAPAAACYPSVGVSCNYTPAPTTQTTSQVLAPNTIGFNTQPANGQQTYTPVVQSGTPDNGAVTITVSGNATTDGTTVTFLDNGVVAITASQNGAAPVTQVVQVSGVLTS